MNIYSMMLRLDIISNVFPVYAAECISKMAVIPKIETYVIPFSKRKLFLTTFIRIILLNVPNSENSYIGHFK